MSLIASGFAALKAFLGFQGVAETGLKIIEKVTGTDFTDQQKADFILEYHKVRKHESPTRRLIAVMMLIGLMLFSFSWLVFTVWAHTYLFFAIDGDTLKEVAASENLARIKAQPLISLSNDILIFLKDVFTNPLSLIMSFYFIIQFRSK